VFAVCLGKTDVEMSLPFEDGKVFERSNKKRLGVSPGDHSGGKDRQVVGNTMKGFFFFFLPRRKLRLVGRVRVMRRSTWKWRGITR
jgi:hypothetical protein